MKDKLRIFIDMDGVLSDFKKEADKISNEKRPDLVLDFSTFDLIDGAKDGVNKLMNMGHDLFIASTPPWNNPEAWGHKRDWINEHFPELKRKIILTHRKDLLIGDILIDDTTFRGQKDFNGLFIHFGLGPKKMDWLQIIDMFEKNKKLF
tara:strand:- start:164 stop:610 length:447 start_codon:yes stop_codon:yes gene_type:complete